MGMYDTVVFPCTKCGKLLEEQTKAGDRMLRMYPVCDVPLDIAASLNGSVHYCDCGQRNRLRVAVPLPPPTTAMLVEAV
mgnify:CR=1 FL=1